jgi:hypothetical protein
MYPSDNHPVPVNPNQIGLQPKKTKLHEIKEIPKLCNYYEGFKMKISHTIGNITSKMLLAIADFDVLRIQLVPILGDEIRNCAINDQTK